MSRYRDDLAYGDYYGPPAAERWDRERFERMRARPREVDLRYEEENQYRGGRERREVNVEVDERRRSRSRRNYDPYDDRYRPRPEYLDRNDRYEVRDREIAPYRPQAKYDEVAIRRPARPGLLRRQTSLDTFDRPPQPRYDQDERDVNVNVNLTAPEPPRDENYREVRIRKERERDIYRRRREVSSSSSSEEVVVAAVKKVKKGKTRMPKRIVHLRAILDLEHPYEEEVRQ